MMKTLKGIILLISVFLVACNMNTTQETNCNCFDGIGATKDDIPAVTFTFSNGKTLVVCGFTDEARDEKMISEFNVFDCETKQSLVEYGALKSCKIVEKNDTLQIDEYKWLPVNKELEFKFVKIGEQIIYLQDDKVLVSERKPAVEKIEINQDDAALFIQSLANTKGEDDFWEKNILFLETLAIIGNQEAQEALANLEVLTGKAFDGSLSETAHQAKATLEWIKKQ